MALAAEDYSEVLSYGSQERADLLLAQECFSRDEDYTTDMGKKKDSKERYKTPSHVETKNSASQFLSLCHVYYCYLTASASEKNNYGNKDFSKCFKTIFKIISSATASESLPSETSSTWLSEGFAD